MTDADRRAYERPGFTVEYDWPTLKAPFGDAALIPTDADVTLLERHSSSASATRRYDVFRLDGQPSGYVDVPAATRLVAVGRRYIYGFTRDELDLDWLLVYPLPS